MTEHLAAYLRDSGGDDQDMSLDQQENEIRRWAQQNGYIITRFFRDEARPGSSVAGRDAFSRMIDHFRQPGASETGIVIWKYSRFARDIDDAQFYKADLRRRGYKIISIKDNIPEGPEGRFFEAAIDWMNQRFLDDLSTDIKRGIHHVLETYGALPGTPPTGFMRQPIDLGKRRDGSQHIVHRWVPDPEMTQTIQKIWSLRAEGKTYSQIIKEVPAAVARNSLTTMFKNRLYIGTLVYGDKIIENYCDPIIDKQTWDTVQKMRKFHQERLHLSSDAGTMQIRRRNSNHLLSGLIYCSKCGSPMFSHSSKQKTGDYYDRYACTRSVRRGDCDVKYIPAKVLDKAIIKDIQNYFLSPGFIEEIQKIDIETLKQQQSESTKIIHDLKNIKTKIKSQIARVTHAIAETGHSRALLEKLKELELEENVIIEKIETAQIMPEIYPMSKEEIKKFSAAISNDLASDDIEIKREKIRLLVEKIYVERDGQHITGQIRYITPKKKAP